MLCASAADFIEKCDRKFDIIYFDPPYRENELSALARKLPALCNPKGIVVFEFSSGDKFVEKNYSGCDFRKYGKTSVLFIKKEE
jgi:16S rRNA G966 N2-methylase RsmD